MRALIFCKSDGDSLPIEIKKNDFIICADSGAEYAWRCGATPSLFVGDCDSFSKNIADKFSCEKIYLPEEKDCTDTYFAVQKALEKGADEIIICGGLGGRLDHTLGNIATLRHVKMSGKKGFLCNENTIVHYLCDNSKLLLPYSSHCEYISLIALTESTGITLKNLKYPLENYTMKTDFPIGVSNEFVSQKDATVFMKNGEILVILTFKN
ncbi:MAG: thiamine diphosphokinase [Clostridiales bacterium]|nr:MAG: thiamine diphosphokinase [Clostridiales bacterium]